MFDSKISRANPTEIDIPFEMGHQPSEDRPKNIIEKL